MGGVEDETEEKQSHGTPVCICLHLFSETKRHQYGIQISILYHVK